MRTFLVWAAICAAAAWIVIFRLNEAGHGILPFDVYNYYYPNILYAVRALADGGGLLWNPFQNCGQPFLGITETGLFYPFNFYFLLLAPETALRAVLFTNLVIGGLGTYALEREMRVSPAASVAAAVAFVMASTTYNLTTWMPTVQAPFVWMPVAMLCCERLLKHPSLRHALWLGMALAAGLLPGHPQFVLFTCQLVALRLLWGVLDQTERRDFARNIGWVALAMVVMLLLTAAQFLSSLQVIHESVRGTALSPQEIAPRAGSSLSTLAIGVFRHDAAGLFSVVPAFLALVAVVGAPFRRMALFYLLAAVAFLILSLGFTTWVGQVYFHLPGASVFRAPMRFAYVTSFCVAVLVGPAIDTLAAGSWRGVAVAAVALAGFYVWLGGFVPIDWLLAGMVLVGSVLAAGLPAGRFAASTIIVITIAFAPILAPSWSGRRYLTQDAVLRTHEAVFERLQQRLTPGDRVQLMLPRDGSKPGLQEKTTQLFRLRSTSDYETQMSQRYGEYRTMMIRGFFPRSVNDVYFTPPWKKEAISWSLLNIAAARYIVVAKTDVPYLDPIGQRGLRLVDGDAGINVYENPAALPRAYYVPQIAVEPDARARLTRLARGLEDRRRLALVPASPPSGFQGVPGNDATADARFVIDQPEHVVIETVAPERGFVIVADQFFPAWSATVNGQPAPIQVGNHAFRLIEVPQGPVTIEFHYAATRLWIGALVSGVTLLLVAIIVLSSPRDRR